MKKRTLSILLALAMTAALVGSAFAAARWNNTDSVDLFLAFNNSTAECGVDVYGKIGTTKIDAKLELQVMNSRGNYTTCVTFPTQTSYSQNLYYTGYAYNRPAGNYRLFVTATVYNASGVGETVTSHFDKTYNG